MKKLDVLKKWGVRVIVVLDGARNPKKAETNKSRADAAGIAKQTVVEMRRRPITSPADIKKFITACTAYKDLRQDIISDLIDALMLAKIPFVNAAFEAEIQFPWKGKDWLLVALVPTAMLSYKDLRTYYIFKT